MDNQHSDGGAVGGRHSPAPAPAPAPAESPAAAAAPRPRAADQPAGPSTSTPDPRPAPGTSPDDGWRAVPGVHPDDGRPSAAGTGVADGRRWSRQRLWLGVGAGSVILLLAGGVGFGVVRYAAVTTPRTDTPDATVDNYLRALLVERSIDAARDLACPQTGGLAAVEDLRDEAIDREREFPDGRVQITWGALASTPDGPGRVTVETDVSVMGVFDSQVRSRRVDTWRFGLVEDGGWQVCRAEKL